MANLSDDTEVRQPKLLSYCSALYERFVAESAIEVVEDVELIVWRGKVTITAKDVGIPDGTYKRVMDQLTRMKCVEQVERGFRGSAPTSVILHRPPTVEVWQDESRGRVLTRGETPAILSRRLDDLERRLEGIDIKRALAELQKEIDDVRSLARNLNSTQNE